MQEHLETLLAEGRAEGRNGFPRFVEKELRGFLGCGVLALGFCRVVCTDCGDEDLLAFSCKGRAVCSSCQARRMTNTAAVLVDEVLPPARYRQWTLSVPWALRARMASNPAFLAKVLRVFLHSVFAWQRKKARALGLIPTGLRRGQEGWPASGAVTSVQRFGSKLNAHTHFHSIIPDALWVRGDDGTTTAVPLPTPGQVDVERICQSIARRVRRWDATRVGEGNDLDPGDDSALSAALAEASQPLVTGKALGPERLPRERTAFVDGFSLDANPVAEAEDRAGLERLIRYGTRPAFAQSRLSLTASGKVSYKLKRPWFTGQTHVVLQPVAFLRRLVALIPPPRQNTIRYHGCFAPHARARPALIALVPGMPGDAPEGRPPVTCGADGTPGHAKVENPAPTIRRTTRYSWAQLYKRVFAEDLLVCSRCGGPRKLIGVLSETNPVPLRAILRHLGLPTEPPRTAPARASPQADFWGDGL